MKKVCALLLSVFVHLTYFAQSGGEVKGVIKDAITGETVVGASVKVAEGKVAMTDINGNYSIAVDSGIYNVIISYVGFEPQSKKIVVGNKPYILNFSLETKMLNEVEVVADIAKSRETPIAFANISAKQIAEELGTRDLPMLLNSTPGVYATESGGGSGDARVNVRGFDQRNVAVMVDGIPVNDMENGQVYWSNWDGLGDITQTMQVQRGLGASKLAIPSVGGTINIITKGIDGKFGATIKQEVNAYGLYKTSFGVNSGLLKSGWGVTVAGSRKWGNEWADGTYVDAWSYFAKVQKRFKKHLFSLSANGAPQSHGQRYDKLPIAVYSKSFADALGINSDSVIRNSVYTSSNEERGLAYNPNWGRLTQDGGTSDGKITFFPKSKHGNVFNERVNFFHKPQFNLSHFWSPNEKLSVSTIIYLSIGHGGGTALKVGGIVKDTLTGTLDAQSIYDYNATSISGSYSTTEHSASNYLRAANNDHIWYGVISSWNYKVNEHLSTLFGIDARSYKGTHYQTVYNLMNGDYAIENPQFGGGPNYTVKGGDANQPTGFGNTQYGMKRVGDKVSYYNDAKVKWGGLFAQAEYKIKKWTVFLTGTLSQTGYQRIDYFKRKDLVIDGNTFEQAVGYGDVFYYNGTDHVTAFKGATVTTNGDTTFIKNGSVTQSILNATGYTNQSEGARFATTKQKWFLGYTIKGGANYNINERHHVFANLGYLNMAPLMNTVFDNNNHEYLNIKNQKVYAVEGGYGFKHPKFAANVNLYYTIWQNKPLTGSKPFGGSTVYYNIIGLNALHKGIEIDMIYKVMKNLEVEGLVSLGDWRTTSGSKADITDESGNIVESIDFSAKGVHVGDAAQTQVVGSARYVLFKNLYIKPRYTYFSDNYSNFDPKTLIDDPAVGYNKDRDSWRMPDYALWDVFVGYDYTYQKVKFGISAGILNVFDKTYITDGQNNGDLTTQNFDANSATVYMGMGRRLSMGLKITF